MAEPEKQPESNLPEPRQGPPNAIDARDLFHGAREVWIEHDGVRYRLRITRRNKLILQK
jgi:hemin uptake protein HemP